MMHGVLPRAARGAVLASVLAMLGCGGAPKAPTAPADVKAPAVEAGAGRRAPSKRLRESFPLAASDITAYADLGAAFGAATTASALRNVEPFLASLSEAQRKCFRTFVASAKELAYGTSEEKGDVLVVRFEPADAFAPCVAVWKSNADPTTVPGASVAAATPDQRTVSALGGGIFASGPRELVEAAMHGGMVGSASLGALTLGPDEVLAFAGTLPRGKGKASGGLVLAKERTRFAVSAELTREADAKEVEMLANGPAFREEVIRELAAADKTGEAATLLRRLLGGLSATRKGATLDVAYELRGTPEQQANDVGALAAVATSAVRAYIAKAKEAEARNVVGQIARDIISDFEREELGPKGAVVSRKKKKLASYPPVPKAVPRGAKVQTSPEDWKPWEKLRFEMSGPQYYQYEVRAAKDGESAEVIAHGDLNGDGKLSTFKLGLRIRRSDDTVVVDPKIEETDPDE